MSKFLFCLLILPVSSIRAQVFWHPDSTLNGSHFVTVDTAFKLAYSPCVSISPYFLGEEEEYLVFRIDAVFDPECSIKNDSVPTEAIWTMQVFFDELELQARKLRNAFEGQTMSKEEAMQQLNLSSDLAVDKAFDLYFDKFDGTSKNERKFTRWKRVVKRELRKLDRYSDQIIRIKKKSG
jgi:hypothetical protein